jgi:hypothetical protein
VNLDLTFLFWPVRVHGIRDGWVFGEEIPLQQLPHKDLLQKGRLRWRRKREMFTEQHIEDSFRHYESLGIAMHTGRRLMEIFQLDEQQFTDQVALVPEERAKEALMKFLNLPDRDDNAAVRFIKEFGRFDEFEVEDGKFNDPRLPAWLRETLQDLGRSPACGDSNWHKADPFATDLAVLWAIRDDLQELWNLSIAIDKKDCEIASQECIRRRPSSAFDPQTRWLEMGKAIIRVDLSTMVNSEPQPPRIILWEKRGAPLAMTMAKTVRSGLYLTLLNLIGSRTKFGNCPNCGGAFIVTAKQNRYCSDACQNAAKVRRFRERRKQQLH